mgnify:CR=1 FL=1
MALPSGPRALVVATFLALSVGFVAGYALAPREAPPTAAGIVLNSGTATRRTLSPPRLSSTS